MPVPSERPTSGSLRPPKSISAMRRIKMMCHGCVSPVMSETVGPVGRRRGELEVPTGNRGSHSSTDGRLPVQPLLPGCLESDSWSDGVSKRRRMAATLVATPGRSEQQERLADAAGCGGLEYAGIDEPAHPGEAAARI